MQFDSHRLQRVTALLESYLDEQKYACLDCAVIKDNELVFSYRKGMQDLDSKTPLQANALFRIYSMTKPVTAVALMMLYERGLFQLSDPLHLYLPELANLAVIDPCDPTKTVPAKRPITITDLLTHQAGFSYDFNPDCPVAALYRERGLKLLDYMQPSDTFIQELASLPLRYQPGEHWLYSIASDIQGVLVERLSNKTLAEFFQEEIFTPLGMQDTAFWVPPEKQSRLTTCYTHSSICENPATQKFSHYFAELLGEPTHGPFIAVDSAKEGIYLRDPAFYAGGRGLVSTRDDFLAFCQMLLNKGHHRGSRLLSAYSVDYMTANHLDGDLVQNALPGFSEMHYPGIGFGFGVGVTLAPHKAKILGNPGEYGWGGAASTAFFIDPTENMIVLLLTQCLPSSLFSIRPELRVSLYQALTA